VPSATIIVISSRRIPAFCSLRRIVGRRTCVGVMRVISSTAIATLFPLEQNVSILGESIGLDNDFCNSRTGDGDERISCGEIIPNTRLFSSVKLTFDLPYGTSIFIKEPTAL